MKRKKHEKAQQGLVIGEEIEIFWQFQRDIHGSKYGSRFDAWRDHLKNESTWLTVSFVLLMMTLSSAYGRKGFVSDGRLV